MKDTLIIVPCFNAERTILNVIDCVSETGFKNIVIGDDCSTDNTVQIIKENKPELKLIEQITNIGYGGNQKELYNYAIKHNFEYVIMIHGDNQYSPYLIPVIHSMLHYAKYDFVFGSRITGGNAIKGGMPLYKYIANRFLTLFQNIFTGYKLSEYHSGLRGYNCNKLKKIDYNSFSDDFIFDNQIILELMKSNSRIGEVSCETIYKHESSSINFKRSLAYGLGVIFETFRYLKSKE